MSCSFNCVSKFMYIHINYVSKFTYIHMFRLFMEWVGRMARLMVMRDCSIVEKFGMDLVNLEKSIFVLQFS